MPWKPIMSNRNTQKNSRCRPCGDRDEIVILSQKKFKIRHDWVGKVIRWELCKILTFYHTEKWYMQKTRIFKKKKMHEILRDFEIQTGHRMPPKKKTKVSKVCDCCRGWPEGSFFDSYYTKVSGATPFPGFLHFIRDAYLIMLSVKQGGIKYHF